MAFPRDLHDCTLRSSLMFQIFSICFQNMVVISLYFSELLVLKEVNIYFFLM